MKTLTSVPVRGRIADHIPGAVRLSARAIGVAIGLTLLLGICRSARAEDTYTAPDGKLVFSYARRWQVENVGDRVRLTAPDGTHFFLLRDTITSPSGDSPAANSELMARATELVKPILSNAEFGGAQPLTMDHGVGAAFRFHGPVKTDIGPTTTVYIAFIGRHSIVILPEKAGQSSQSIGLASIFQSIAFTDALPRITPQRTRQPGSAAGSETMTSGPGTVSFVSDIAPILKEKCEVCHRASSPIGGFSVSSYADIMRGGRHGEPILAGKPEASSLLDYLTGKRDLMPKGGPPLPASQIALIRKWISEGARQQVGGPAAATAGIGTSALPGATGPGAERRARRMRAGAGIAANGAVRTATTGASAIPELLEAYTGHLVPNDLSFTLRLRMDKSATAVWELAPGHEVHYAGTYAGEDGSYAVTLAQTGSPPVEQGKSLTIEMRPRGTQETGLYGLDGARPRREISELDLSETRSAGKKTPSGPIKFGQQQGNKQGRQQNRQQNRQRRRR